jgi:alanine racemase
MVRLGLGLYGLDPSGADSLKSDASASKLNQLSTVTRWVTRISAIRSVPAGEGIGYGSHSASLEERQIATLAVGYADGLSRHLSQGKGSVWIKGQLAPIVGNICMDLTMVDVTHLEAQVGDEVELFGSHLSINRQAQQAGTISYELLTSISQRVARVYVGEW